MAVIDQVSLPQFGRESTLPQISVQEYQERLSQTRARMQGMGFDVLVVYGDREHFANLAFLTGFDPRFEEALLLLDRMGDTTLLVGNECLGYLPDPAIGYEVELFQELSLMGQPRESSRPLREILSGFGIGNGARVGCVGWKYFESELLDNAPCAVDIPSYVVDVLRALTGNPDLVRNAAALFMNPRDGLRLINSADQIAQFEFAATRASDGVRAVLEHIGEGVAESEIEHLMDGTGLPLSAHRMISFGSKVERALSSPSSNRAKLGDMFTVAFALTGSLIARAGAIAAGPEDLTADVRDWYERLVKGYFDVAAAWYENVKVGAVAREVFSAVHGARDQEVFELALNPGHYIHLEEWLHSPFTAGSDVRLTSGMALQADIIPVSKGPFCFVNAEDGIVLADTSLRAKIAAKHPECWRRICMRREFMRETLGIALDESVLPLSNTPGWLAPYILKPDRALVHR